MRENLPKILFILLLIVILPGTIFAQSENKQSLSFKMNLSSSSCQISIWIEKISGSFKNTVFVTYSTAKSGLGNNRLNVLPVWAHRLNIDYGDGKIYPTFNNPLPDAVTAASPPKGEFVWNRVSSEYLESGDYYFFVEINKSYYNDQPSVVWRGIITIGENNSSGNASLIGHGSETGSDGNINPDLSSLTTALNLLSDVQVEYKFQQVNHNPPEILTSSLPDAYTGDIYNKKIDVFNIDSADSILFQLLDAPDWLSVNQSGVLTGSPSDSDVAIGIPVVIIVQNQSGLTNTLSTELNVIKNILYVESRPEKFRIDNPYPNPFNKNISFRYEIPIDCNVRLTIYDILGREILLLQNGLKNKGTYIINWNGLDIKNSTSGSSLYLYSFSAGDYFKSGKIMYLK